MKFNPEDHYARNGTCGYVFVKGVCKAVNTPAEYYAAVEEQRKYRESLGLPYEK